MSPTICHDLHHSPAAAVVQKTSTHMAAVTQVVPRRLEAAALWQVPRHSKLLKRTGGSRLEQQPQPHVTLQQLKLCSLDRGTVYSASPWPEQFMAGGETDQVQSGSSVKSRSMRGQTLHGSCTADEPGRKRRLTWGSRLMDVEMQRVGRRSPLESGVAGRISAGMLGAVVPRCSVRCLLFYDVTRPFTPQSASF